MFIKQIKMLVGILILKIVKIYNLQNIKKVDIIHGIQMVVQTIMLNIQKKILNGKITMVR